MRKHRAAALVLALGSVCGVFAQPSIAGLANLHRISEASASLLTIEDGQPLLTTDFRRSEELVDPRPAIILRHRPAQNIPVAVADESAKLTIVRDRVLCNTFARLSAIVDVPTDLPFARTSFSLSFDVVESAQLMKLAGGLAATGNGRVELDIGSLHRVVTNAPTSESVVENLLFEPGHYDFSIVATAGNAAFSEQGTANYSMVFDLVVAGDPHPTPIPLPRGAVAGLLTTPLVLYGIYWISRRSDES